MNCKSCGTSNPEGAIFCRKCGEKLKEDSSSGCLKILAWLVAISVIVYVIALVYNNQSNYTPSNPSPSLPSPATPSNHPTKTKTYLHISDNDLNFDEEGGSKTISISTDGEWEIFGDTLDWITLSKNSSSITMRVISNKRSKRTGYFTILADDFHKQVKITQSGYSGPWGEIEKIWVNHNEHYEDGREGMIIHVAFKAHNMLNEKGKVSVFFYHIDGTPLTDTNDNYCTSDGQVSTWQYFFPRDENSNYNDFEIFMPYRELHLEETSNLYFIANIRCEGKRISENSDKISFYWEKD